MNSLQIQIITHNNEATLRDCLESLKPLKNAVIHAFDCGSTDQTLNILGEFGVNPIQVKYKDFSKIRNEFFQTKKGWKFYILPWEKLLKGAAEIETICESGEEYSFNCKVVNRKTIAKEIRLWNKPLNFVNPVFEILKDKKALNAKEITIQSNTRPITPEFYDLISRWKINEPLSSDPYYYHALTVLTEGRYQDFLPLAENYLALQKTGVSSTLMRYYLSMMQVYFKMYQKGLENILKCIAVNCVLSEFWCLLGDIYYQTGQMIKARTFYENAIILGERRKNDRWPIDIPKLKSYPSQMIAQCNQLLGVKNES